MNPRFPASLVRVACGLIAVVGAYSQQRDDQFNDLAQALVMPDKPEKVAVGVGSFVYENTSFMSPFSAMVRDELEIALNQTGRFKVVARDRLADLQTEGKFQGQEILEPGTGVKAVTIAGIQGIVRGRFYSSGREITVYAELAWLEGGEVRKSKVAIPIEKVKAKVWPDPSTAARQDVGGLITPQNLEQSLANVKDLAAGRLAKLPQDFQVEVFTTDGKRAYAQRENVSFRVRASEDCHIAVLCHQSDGSTVVLFPNRFASNTLIPGNKAIDIPGTHKSGFEIEIGPPYGSDVVEVIACTKPSELHTQLSHQAATGKEQEPFLVLTRGMAVKGIDKAIETASGPVDAKPRWSHDSIVVSTFPKP